MLSPLNRIASSRPVRSAVGASFSAWSRRRVAKLATLDAIDVQERTLLRLVKHAAKTEFGKDHGFKAIRTSADYRRAVPVRSYEDLWNDYLRDRYPVFENLTWPGRIPYLALSSGTTQGGSKYLPVSRAMLASNVLAGRTMLAYSVVNRKRSRLFSGRIFFLGGSTDLEEVAPGVRQGDLSGIAAREVPDLARPYTFPPLDLALVSDWDQKIDLLAERSMREPITMLGGVPSWLLVLFDRVRQKTGKATIAEVWPTLELIVHGGVKFDPYREAFQEAIGGSDIAFQDAYACSEGFVGFGDPETGLLRPMIDHGIYYEFVPVEDLSSDRPARHSLGEVEVGVNYAIVVTTCAGMWSHRVGDVVRFERRDPYLFTFAGRTKDALSAFGEHLIGEEVEGAIAEVSSALDASVRDWHVGPVFHRGGGHHLYVVEFLKPPASLPDFRDRLDASLCRRNDDYRAHRAEGVGLPPPAVLVSHPGGIAAWMKSRGKLGGQHKVPRMDDSGSLTAELAAFLFEEERVAAELGAGKCSKA